MVMIELDKKGAMTIGEFEWDRFTNILRADASLWPDELVPAIILIQGRTRTVEYVYRQTLDQYRLLEYVALIKGENLPLVWLGYT